MNYDVYEVVFGNYYNNRNKADNISFIIEVHKDYFNNV